MTDRKSDQFFTFMSIGLLVALGVLVMSTRRSTPAKPIDPRRLFAQAREAIRMLREEETRLRRSGRDAQAEELRQLVSALQIDLR